MRYRGIKVYFSSDLAARKWLRDPVSYLDKKIVPQLGDLILAERLIQQRFCPVHPKRKVSLKDPTVTYEGKRVYLFDKEAVRIWNSAPGEIRRFGHSAATRWGEEMPPRRTRKTRKTKSRYHDFRTRKLSCSVANDLV